MATISDKGSRGPMVHIRLDETTHRDLKVFVAQSGTTIQKVVEDMIRKKVINSKTKNIKK